MKREILVTSALPYANGPIHLGHLLEYIQTDIWVRFQRLLGHTCYYVCADDAHGTPIMLKARELNITAEQLIEKVKRSHTKDFSDFLISFDNYHSTHSEENYAFAKEIYEKLKAADLIFTRNITQAYDNKAEMFLPDRFIKGDCPRCHAPDQYGDCCECCGATYTPTELNNAVSVLSGEPPSTRESEHYFFSLSKFESALKQWLANEQVQPEIRNKLNEWFENKLLDWDISRDAPYFGFKIPDHPKKYFYVWLDAPIGYMASFKQLCKRIGLNFDSYWKKDSATELYHFIGKDIAYFHMLFWPAILEGAGFRKPTGVYCHGFVTINKEKMSKSRGTFITARNYLENLNAEYLRYYFAAKLTDGIEDIDLNLHDFILRINSNLVGKVINIAGRCAGFIDKYFGGEMRCDEAVTKHPAVQAVIDITPSIADAYETRRYACAMRKIMQIADMANQYIDQEKPWRIAKEETQHNHLNEVCSVGLVLFAYIIRLLAPVLPRTSEKVEQFLNLKLNRWDAPLFRPQTTRHRIKPFMPLMQRIEETVVRKLTTVPKSESDALKIAQEKKPMIDYADFAKLDLRVATILTAEPVDGADKLLRLKLNDGDTTRSVLAGIKSSYTPEQLTGRQVVLVANLKPKKMRFGISEGMILAAGKDKIFLLKPDAGAVAGMTIK